MKTYDFLWKGVIEELFIDFLRFFFPKEYRDFDLKRGFEFLDKELEQLFPQANNKERRVDKLVKVWKKNGQDVWILIHIEVQGYLDSLFGYRMFVYFYRIHDRFQKDITSLAILTDNDPDFRPTEYTTGYGKTKLIYKFPVYKVLDQDFDKLDKSKNIFAVVIQTVLVALKKGTVTEETLLDLKLDLCKRLLKKRFPKRKIEVLLNFISYYIRLDKPKLKLSFEQNLDNLQNKRYNMTVRELLLHDAEMDGIEKGERLGIEKGERLGIEKGERLGMEKGVEKGDYLRLKRAVKKMSAKGISIVEIADNLDAELLVIQKIWTELAQELGEETAVFTETDSNSALPSGSIADAETVENLEHTTNENADFTPNETAG